MAFNHEFYSANLSSSLYRSFYFLHFVVHIFHNVFVVSLIEGLEGEVSAHLAHAVDAFCANLGRILLELEIYM